MIERMSLVSFSTTKYPHNPLSSLLDELEAPLLDFLINLHMGSVKAPVCNRTVALHRPQMRGQVVLLGATKSLSQSGFFERLRVCQFLHA